jgi:hypothetical protein
MLQDSSLEEQTCQPVLAYCGVGAVPNLNTDLQEFKNFNFKNIHEYFFYEIKISQFISEAFWPQSSPGFAYLIQIYVISEDEEEPAFSDVNIFLEKDLEDLIEYAIILPRLFKRHHRYVIDLQKDSACSFKEFGEKIELWKKANGLF